MGKILDPLSRGTSPSMSSRVCRVPEEPPAGRSEESPLPGPCKVVEKVLERTRSLDKEGERQGSVMWRFYSLSTKDLFQGVDCRKIFSLRLRLSTLLGSLFLIEIILLMREVKILRRDVGRLFLRNVSCTGSLGFSSGYTLPLQSLSFIDLSMIILS